MKQALGNLHVLKTGPGTSVQDLGRVGFAQFGVPISGALDKRSFLWVNHLLRNKASDAVLEICQPGLKVQFDTPTQICFAGAKAVILLNGAPISGYSPVQIQANDQLEIGAFLQGSVLYLGIKNGFQSENSMNSKSWFAGITEYGYARKEDLIPYANFPEIAPNTASQVRWDFHWASEQQIEAYPGPEWDLLDFHTKKLIESSEFTVSELKNRMAIQLKELFPNKLPEMATAAVFPGTVQLTAGGKLLVLLQDAQVTGGYPRILQISEESISILVQKKGLEKIRFSLKINANNHGSQQ